MLAWLRKLYIAVVLFPVTLIIKGLVSVFRHLVKAKGLDPDANYSKIKHEEFVSQLESAFGEPPVVNRLVKLEADGHSFGIIKRTISPKRSISAVSGPMKYPTATDISDNEIKEIAEEMYDVPQRPEDLANACFERTYPSISSAMTDTEALIRKLAETHGGLPKKLEIDTDARMGADGYVNYSASVTVEDGYSTYFTGEPPISCSMDFQPIDLHKEVDLSELKVEVDEDSLRVWRETFAAAQADPDFQIFTYLDAGEAPTPKKKSSKKPAAKTKKPVKKVSAKKKK